MDYTARTVAKTLGKMSLPVHDSPGLRLDLEIGSFSDFYSVAVTLNGVPSRKTRKKDLGEALRWGQSAAAEQLRAFTPVPQQLRFAGTGF